MFIVQYNVCALYSIMYMYVHYTVQCMCIVLCKVIVKSNMIQKDTMLHDSLLLVCASQIFFYEKKGS